MNIRWSITDECSYASAFVLTTDFVEWISINITNAAASSPWTRIPLFLVMAQLPFVLIWNHSPRFSWFAGNVASGSAAGATTSMFLYRLDYARTRLGTDARECQINGKRQFKGLFDVYARTISSDGIVGLYRGFSVSILGITMYRGMYFGIYDTMKPIVLVGPLEGNFFASFLLGWSVTTVSGVYAYPFDTIRRRMMLTSGQPLKYRNPMHAFHEIVHLEGFRALYRGVSSNVLLGVAGTGVLAGYDQLRRVAYTRGFSFGFKALPKAL